MGAFNDLDWATYTSMSLRDESFPGDMNHISFPIIQRSLWSNPIHNILQPQINTSYIPFQDSRHFSTSSSEYSPISMSSITAPQSATSEDFPTFRSPIEPNFSTALPFSTGTFGHLLNEQNSLHSSSGEMSSNSSSISVQEFPTQEYQTAKEKSLLHRRKQNRAAQRTFRQRKEVERVELQARFDASLERTTVLQGSCDELAESVEELKAKIKALETENLELKKMQKVAPAEDGDGYFSMRKKEEEEGREGGKE